MIKTLILAASVLCALPALGQSDVKVVPGPVTGEAAVENGNVKLAREQALQHAMRDALQQGAGAVIDSASVTEGGTLVQDRIFVHANGYIKSYEIGTDGVQDGVYTVSISDVHVGLGELSKDMAAVHAMLMTHAHPRLYLLLREQSIESLGGTAKTPQTLADLSQGIVEQRVEKQLAAVGWHIVDPEVASGKVHVENALTTDLASLNGRDFATTGAEFVALGSIVVRKAAQGDGMTAGLCQVESRAVINIKATDTGETVASVEDVETKDSISCQQAARMALEVTGDKVVKELSSEVLEHWRKRDNGVGQLHLHVAVADYDVLQAFEEQLQRGVANVQAVDEVSFNDGKADLAVSMAGTNSRQLAGSLSGKTVKGMKIKVTRVTSNIVEVKLVK